MGVRKGQDPPFAHKLHLFYSSFSGMDPFPLKLRLDPPFPICVYAPET